MLTGWVLLYLLSIQYSNVDHFDGKAEVEAYAKETGIKYASVQPAAYMQNYVPGGFVSRLSA